jgi:hypothetical protein
MYLLLGHPLLLHTFNGSVAVWTLLSGNLQQTALHIRSKQIMNTLASFATEERPLSKTALALERSEDGDGAAKAGLPPMHVEWTVSNLGVEWSDDYVANSARDRPTESILSTPQTPSTTTAGIGRKEVEALVQTHFDHIRVSHYEQHTLTDRPFVLTHAVHGLRTHA